MRGLRRKLLLGLVVSLTACSSQQLAVVQHFCDTPIDVAVVYDTGREREVEPVVTSVRPGVPTTVWDECCAPDPPGNVTITAGDWEYTEAAARMGGEEIIEIDETACR